MAHLDFLNNYSKISKLEDPLKLMKQLGKKMPKELENLDIFNKTYLIITSGVMEKLETGFFSDSKWIEKLAIEFSKFYFKSIVLYLKGKKAAKAWQYAFDTMKKDGKPKFVYILLGANAHINNDLPIVLSKFYKKDDSDFIKFNEIVKEKVSAVIKELKDDSDFWKMVKLFSPVYGQIARKIITEWREEAWENARRIKASSKPEKIIKEVEYKAFRKAKDIAGLPDIDKIMKILK